MKRSIATPLALLAFGSTCASAAQPGAQTTTPATQAAQPALAEQAVQAQPIATGDTRPEDQPRILHTVDRGWTLRFEPAFWYAAPRGEITMPASIGPVTFDGTIFEPDANEDLSTLDADNPEGAFRGSVHFARDRWRFTISANHLSTDGDYAPTGPGRLGDAFFTIGDSVRTDFSMTSFEATGAYTLFHGPYEDEAGDPDRFRYTLELLAGARFENLDVDVSVRPGTGARPEELSLEADASELFGQPIGGVRLSMDFFRDFTVEVGATVGYWSIASGSTASTWDILAAFTWRPMQNVGLQVGYQYLGVAAERDVDDGRFEFTGSSAGLFAGLAVQF